MNNMKTIDKTWGKTTFADIMSPAKVVLCGNRKGMPVLSITMHDGIVEQKDRFKKVIASRDTSKYKVVKNGQLVIAFPIDEGLIYTQDVADEGIMSPAYNVWDVNYENFDRRFLGLYFHSPFAMAYYKNNLRGTTQRRRALPKEILLSMPIPKPSLSKQKEIVVELDEISSTITLLQAQFTDLDTLEHSLFVDMFGNPESNDKGFQVISLGEICSAQNGLVDPKIYPYSDMYHVGPANIVSHTGEIINLKLAKEENLISGKYLFDSGMVLYSKIRPSLNKVAKATFKGICSADMYPLIPKDNVTTEYLFFVLRTKRFLDYVAVNSGRANIPKINREALMAYQTMLPPICLQKSFASQMKVIEETKSNISSQIAEMQTLYKSRMQYWFD